MLRVYDCLTQDHDLRLVVLAAVICFFASFTAISLETRAKAANAAALTPVDMNAVTIVGAPSYASGVHM